MHTLTLTLMLGLAACKDKGVDSGTPASTPERAPERPAEPSPWQAAGSLDSTAFAWAIAVGDVTPQGAIVAARTTETQVSLTLVRQDVDEWVTDTELPDLQVTDGHLRVELDGLRADTAYSLALYAADGERRSAVGRFRTALDADAWRVITFGATSGLDDPDAPWPSLSHAARSQLDFFAFLGDTVYADDADTLDEYRTWWDAALSTRGLYDLNLSTSMIATWDDHELANNWSWEDISQDRYDAAYDAYREAMPARDGPGGSLIWRKLSWGAVADVFVLDCRAERDADHYISDEQMAWLKQGLTDSEARFKFILNSVPITDLSAIFGNAQEEDRWQGYPQQRDEILSYIEDQGVTGLLWVSGDVHYPGVLHVDPSEGLAWDQWEVLTGPSGSRLNVGAQLFAGDEQYPITFAEWNYTRFEADPGTGQVSVDFIGDDGEVLDGMVLQL